MRKDRNEKVLMPALMAVLVACLLGATHVAREWLPPVSPPGASPWVGFPMPIMGSIWINDHSYRITGSLQADLRGRFYITGADAMFITLTVSEDDVPVEVDKALGVEIATMASNLRASVVAGVKGPTWTTEMDDVVARAAMAPGSKVSAVFPEQQRWERWMQVRVGAMAVLWVVLPCSVVWLGVRVTRRVSAAQGARRGRCSRCGYELAGLPDGEPCPECGTPAVQSRDPYVERLKKKEWKN